MPLTKDGKVVANHDWINGKTQTIEEFVAQPTEGGYTRLSFADIVRIMKDYPDITIITDTKYTDPVQIKAQFKEMLYVINSLNAIEILERFIVQIYNTEMYDTLKEIYKFPRFIFTLYQTWDGTDMDKFSGFCNWVVAHKEVEAITLWENLYSKKIEELAGEKNVDIYVHTVNDPIRANELFSNGVKKIYTDILP